MKNLAEAKAGKKRAKIPASQFRNLAQITQQRQTVYAFLRRLYEKELPSELLREISRKIRPLLELADILPNARSRSAVRQLVKFTNSISTENLDELQIKLAADYARLFLSINKIPPHPSESVYREGAMMQYYRDEVLQTYWSFGVDKKTEFTEPEDHIAVELGFMVFLCEKAQESLQKGGARESRKYIQSQNDFLEKHLLKWVPRLVDDIIAAGQTPFYKSIAILTNEFLKMDVSAINDLLKELKAEEDN